MSSSYNSNVDSYIARAAPFAQPVLEHLRELIHKTCPDVAETIKWGMPAFDYKGSLCSFASFKNHCSFGFWKAGIMEDGESLRGDESKNAMGNIGKITSVKDLPSNKVMVKWLKEAMRLNDEGIKVPKTISKHSKKVVITPDYLVPALKKNKAAWVTFDKGSPSFKREYVEWITDAKSEATRLSRLQQSIEWLAEGKGRNWKYQSKK
ncbi:MAG: DUF1801 domain-containing protein [Chitinophagaceae bacterium]|nr:DUF1801 domain-containing protein [Chitinophagaceae bacterium]